MDIWITSIATVTLGGGTLKAKLSAASLAGFDGVEMTSADLADSGLRPAEVARMARDLGLRILLYQPLRDFEGLPQDRLKEGLARAERMFEATRALGTDTLLACSSTAPDAIDDDGRAAAQLGLLADRAREHGLRIAFEALAWGTAISDTWHAWQVVQAAGRPNLGIALDSFHFLARRDTPARILAIPGEKIYFVQLADARTADATGRPPDYRTWSRHHRMLPGSGDLDLTGFAGHVDAAGYQGPWSLEVFSDELSQEDPGDVAARAHMSLAGLLDAALPDRTAAAVGTEAR
jgi:4-hydroxyphenylpyruvate dioxygenase